MCVYAKQQGGELCSWNYCNIDNDLVGIMVILLPLRVNQILSITSSTSDGQNRFKILDKEIILFWKVLPVVCIFQRDLGNWRVCSGQMYLIFFF